MPLEKTRQDRYWCSLVVLTVAFEFSFGHFVFRRSWGDLAVDYAILRDGLLPIGLVVLMFAPIIAARLRSR